MTDAKTVKEPISVSLRGNLDENGRRSISVELDGRRVSFFDKPRDVYARLRADLPGERFLVFDEKTKYVYADPEKLL